MTESTPHIALDVETRSPVDIKKHGAFVYFEHPEARVLIASYRIDQGPMQRWAFPEPCPHDMRLALELGATVSAHNAAFECLALAWLAKHLDWPCVRPEQFRCTAATAAAMALPRDLYGLGLALGLTKQKDADGKRLIRKFSIPRRPRKDEDPKVALWNAPEDHPEDFAAFKDYCDRDVETEEEADRRIISLSDDEQELWLIDQRINQRGIRIDRKSARAAIRLAAAAKTQLDTEMRLTTGSYVSACSQVGKLRAWVEAQGVAIPSAGKADIEDLLSDKSLPSPVRRALEIRQEAAKTSVAKLSAFLNRTSADGRIRGAFLFCAAGTGRWSSVGAQLHNMPRPRKVYEDAKPDTRILFNAFRRGDLVLLKNSYGPVLGRVLWLISDALRGFVWSAPGHDLLAADYSGIEGAVAAWFAGENWKIDALHKLIVDPSLPDMYRQAAARIFNVLVESLGKKDIRRQLGKVSELSLQYQGGVNAFRNMARNYGLDLDTVYDPVWASADEERRERALKRYENCVERSDAGVQQLSKQAWLAAELIKVGWRAGHPAIVNSWTILEDAIRRAIETPGTTVPALKCHYLVTRGFLWCKLPSGRCLSYASPRLKAQVWVRQTGVEASEVMAQDEATDLEGRGLVVIQGPAKSAPTALGVNSETKKWERFGLYGGLALENIVQAIARDILAVGIKNAEKAGYPVIGHVHDEIITEVPRGFGDVEAFERLICDLPEWTHGLPLTASGWRGKRYRK